MFAQHWHLAAKSGAGSQRAIKAACCCNPVRCFISAPTAGTSATSADRFHRFHSTSARLQQPSIAPSRTANTTLLLAARRHRTTTTPPPPLLPRQHLTSLSTMASPTIKLNSGHQMPQVGYGLWKVENASCADMVYNAIKEGYRLFDGACDYGNEVEAGQGVARAIKEGLVKREDLFIVSKLWNSFHDKERVVPICKKQLADWGVDYFDLYLIHFPISIKYVDPSVRYPPGWQDENDKFVLGNATLQSTWEGMEEVAKAGLAKSIGVSNYNGALLLDLLRYAKVKPATLQIEHHPYLVQQDLVDFCKKSDIAVTAYSSFGPQSFRDLDMQLGHDTPLLFENDVITKTAEKHGKTPAQVLLRWATQRGLAVIPKSASPQRLQQNLEVTKFDLSDAELKAISDLDKKLRFNNPLNYGIPIPSFA